MIKNIVFDLGGVLIKKADEEYVKECLTYKEDAENVYKTVFYSPIREKMDKGEIDKESGYKEIFNLLPTRSQNQAKEMYDYYLSHRQPTEDMPEFIKMLKGAGYTLYILSNFFENIEKIKNTEGLDFLKLFDGEFISSKYGVIKPEREIYAKFCEKFNLNPKDCFFIDDREINVKGAIDFGIESTVFTSVKDLVKTMIEKKIL